jgi:hypothetical protein
MDETRIRKGNRDESGKRSIDEKVPKGVEKEREGKRKKISGVSKYFVS